MQVGAGSGVIGARSDCVCCLTSCARISAVTGACGQPAVKGSGCWTLLTAVFAVRESVLRAPLT